MTVRRTVRHRLGLVVFGLALVLLGQPATLAFCARCGSYVDAMCKPHLDELARS